MSDVEFAMIEHATRPQLIAHIRRLELQRRIAERAVPDKGIDLRAHLRPQMPSAAAIVMEAPAPLARQSPKWIPRDWLFVNSDRRADVLPPSYYRHIKATVCKYFGLSVREIDSPRRTKELLECRFACMLLGKELTFLSYPQIGRQTGGRDHTTALHAVRQAAKRCLTDASFCHAITHLRQELKADLDAWREKDGQ